MTYWEWRQQIENSMQWYTPYLWLIGIAVAAWFIGELLKE